VDPAGHRLGFSISLGTKAFLERWGTLDLATGEPVLAERPVPEARPGGWVDGHLVGVGKENGRPAVFAWQAGAPRAIVLGQPSSEFAVHDGTIVERLGTEIRFYRGLDPAPHATLRTQSRLLEFVPACGGRVVLRHPDRLELMDSGGLLGTAPARRCERMFACPSGRVVACVHPVESFVPTRVTLVDFRDGARRDFHLQREHPLLGSPAWSPSGGSLAFPGWGECVVIEATSRGAPVWFDGRVPVCHTGLKRALDRCRKELAIPDRAEAVPLVPLVEILASALEEAKRGTALDAARERFASLLERAKPGWQEAPADEEGFDLLPPASARLHVLAASLQCAEVRGLVRRGNASAVPRVFEEFPPPDHDTDWLPRRVWRSLCYESTAPVFVEALARAWIEALGGFVAGETADRSQELLDAGLGPPSIEMSRGGCPRCGTFERSGGMENKNQWTYFTAQCGVCGFVEETPFGW
jgi:hypothetical protein